jgi:hypothetical protein
MLGPQKKPRRHGVKSFTQWQTIEEPLAKADRLSELKEAFGKAARGKRKRMSDFRGISRLV